MGEQYKYTEEFLSSYALRSEEVARLGRECLSLSKISQLTSPDEPWLLNLDGLQYPSVANLPLKAASSAHFYLEAMAFESTRFLTWEQLRFQVRCDGYKLKSVLGKIIRFAENLRDDRIDNLVEKQAAELIEELDNLFSVELKDFPIDGAVLEMFRSSKMKSHAVKISAPRPKETPSKKSQNSSPFLCQNNVAPFMCALALFTHILIYFILLRKWLVD